MLHIHADSADGRLAYLAKHIKLIGIGFVFCGQTVALNLLVMASVYILVIEVSPV